MPDFWKSNQYLLMGSTFLLSGYWFLKLLGKYLEWLLPQETGTYHYPILNWTLTEDSLVLILLLWLILSSTVYWQLEKRQFSVSFQLKYLHINLSFFSFIIFHIFIYWIGNELPNTGHSYNDLKMLFFRQSEVFFNLASFIFWLGQLFFVLNIFKALNQPQKGEEVIPSIEDFDHLVK